MSQNQGRPPPQVFTWDAGATASTGQAGSAGPPMAPVQAAGTTSPPGTSSPSATVPTLTRGVTAGEMGSLRPLLEALVRKLPRQSESGKSAMVPFTASAAREVELKQEPLVVVPLHIAIFGSCRLAVVHVETGQAELVPLPYDNSAGSCLRIRGNIEVDLNDDGLPDFGLVVDLSSNRYPVVVSEIRIYLSDRSRRTYCYASRLYIIHPNVRSAEALRRMVDGAVSRVGKQVLDCWPGPADGGTPP